MSVLKTKLNAKTDAQLVYYIDHVGRHTEDAVRCAFNILQDRNVELPVDTLERIEKELVLQKENKKKETIHHWRSNVVEDPEAPEYYSQSAIYVFSILFSVFFGSFMLASNCNFAGRKGWQVIIFGFLYTAIALIVLSYIDFNIGLIGPFVVNSLGIWIMYEAFWKRDIGVEKKYRAKPIWKPLIIAAVIFTPIFYFIIKITH
ncbi:hypothetical protein [Pedobacter jejuensis]|uniref:Uncharacterized protein n=1 Tax=Pedobacter jejuensis TaxID=1268550 RepID=A0A3N0BWV1_9SPHI|nr:hypothetical protein [Pedobacter jejuensis]RNL53464.1 hypothetical protein D7004_10315 [Pedobacter jejuensis]